MTTVKHIREALHVDSVSVKQGVFTVRRTFFYTHGYTSDKFAAAVVRAFPTAVVLDHGEVWKAFRGGASVAQSSHWFVKFSVPEVL